MFMQNSAEEVSRPTGIQRARPESGRARGGSLHERTPFAEPLIPVLFLVHLLHLLHLFHVDETSALDEFSTFIRSVFSSASHGGKLLSTVHTLYAGPPVANQTTAPRCPSPLQSLPVLLAALLVVLATLTIAARCYASTTNTSTSTQSLVQFSTHQNPDSSSSVSPIFIKYSNPTRRQLNTSKIVLSRLFPDPLKYVQSDTSVIQADSKRLVYNYYKRQAFRRRKREFDRSKPAGYSNHLDKRREKTEIQIPLPTFRYSVDFSSDRDPVNSNGSDSNSASVQNNSVDFSRVASTFVVDQTYDRALNSVPSLGPGRKRPMPSAHDHENNSLSEHGVLVLVVAVVVLTAALGLVTCVVSHYRGGTAANPHDAAQTPTTAPMLSVVSAGATAGVGGMDRLRGRGAARDLTAASRDRQVRLHAVHTDIAINLPPSISLPDGEEHPFTSRLHIRDTEQESEIYQKCIRPPPNRTVLESESPPPYRSSSAGLLGSTGGCSSSGSSDWSSGGSAPLVVRCHSMSSSSTSTSKRPDSGPSGQKTDFIQKTVKIFTGKKSQLPSPAPTLPTLPALPPPVVIVPSRTRRTPTTADQQNPSTTATTGRPKPNV